VPPAKKSSASSAGTSSTAGEAAKANLDALAKAAASAAIKLKLLYEDLHPGSEGNAGHAFPEAIELANALNKSGLVEVDLATKSFK
jgi:hypothetical protein